MTKYQQDQLKQEQQLIRALKDKGAQVLPGEFGGCIRVVTRIQNGVRSQSVWLGKAGTVDRLKQILAA